jgi:hypothetical protein
MSRRQGRGFRTTGTVRGACLATVGAALLIAGCGGGHDDGPTQLSHQELVSQANAACARANRQEAAVPAPKGTADLVAYLSRSEQIVIKLKADIAGLAAPPADRAAVQRYVAALTHADAALNDMSNAARNDNPSAVKELASQIAAAAIGPTAAHAGFSTCATAPRA